MPFINRKLVKTHLYQNEYNLKGRPFAYIMSARDCWWGRCTFCSWTTTFTNFRARSVDNVLDEIGKLIKAGYKEIFDDAGTITVGKWLKDLCHGMIERGYHKKIYYSTNMRFGACSLEDYQLMKKAGFRLLKYGLESASDKTLQRLNKGTKRLWVIPSCRNAKKAGLTVHLTIMVGYPWETRKDARSTMGLAKKLMINGWADVLQSTVIVPYPGTPLWKEAVENRWFLFDPYDYDRYDMREPVMKAKGMTSDEVMQICNDIYKKIFLTPKYMLQHLKRIRSFEDIRYTAHGLKAVVGHLKDFDPEQNIKS
jgi:anaerobic magnesium-protoporphyrin IX monomethyl ester cyclase